MDRGWKIVTYKDIKVYYLPDLNGGGTDFGQDFIPVIKKLFGRVNSICEFASGPGFIGFSLLANGLCNKLCLIDVNPKATECCNKTVKSNLLSKNVTVYTTDVLKNIPKNEIWDLVVGNPPFFNGTLQNHKKDLLGIDPGWRIHKEFYKNIRRHLAKNGSILFVESLDGSNPKIWEETIKSNGLHYIKSFQYKHSFSRILNRVIRTILALRWNEAKKLAKNYKLIPQKVHSSYFVWSKN